MAEPRILSTEETQESETRAATLIAVLFAAGDPVSAERLAEGVGCTEDEVHALLQEQSDALSFARAGIRLVRMENAWQMCTAPEYASVVRKVLETRKPPQLSQTALEVLSIIAYRQPVTRGYVEKVRGVDSAYTVNMLVDKGLIQECGRLEVPGRPILFATTDVFLRMFGICSLTELPPLAEPLPEKNADEGDGAVLPNTDPAAGQTEQPESESEESTQAEKPAEEA